MTTDTRTTLQRVIDLIARCTRGPEDPPQSDQQLFYDGRVMNDEDHQRAGGYGLDSLDRVEISMEIEDEFNIEISDEESSDPAFNSPAGIAQWIDQHQNGE